MKKLLVFFGVASMVFAFLSSNSMAHVLIKDTSNSKGAILHIQPDDDPVAGERATLYFDMQNKGSGTVQLNVENNKTAEKTALKPVEIQGSLATIAYVFPVQGTYTLTFTVNLNTSMYTFTSSQRISRGEAGSTTPKAYVWAEMLLIGSGIAATILVIVFIQRRKIIAAAAKLRK